MDAIASVEPHQGRVVRAGRRDIFVAEIGEGEPLLMLHGGGPGATGLSNFSRNVPELSKRFRLIVPDMPGYGRSTKGLDRKDPFGDLATAMLGLIDALGVEKAHVARQLARRRLRVAHGARGCPSASTGWFCSARVASTPAAARRPTACSTCSTIIRAKARRARSSKPSCARTSSSTAPRCPTR